MRRSILAITAAIAVVLSSCGDATSDVQVSATTENGAGATTAAPTAPETTTEKPSEPAGVTTSVDVATSSPEEPADTASSASFCQAVTELNTIMVLGAFADLIGDGAQDLYALAKLPELTATSLRMADTAPPRYAEQAATLAAYHQSASELAAERGLATSDLERLAEDLESESLTVEQLLAVLGITTDDLTGLFLDATANIIDMETPVDLLGAELSDLGCESPPATIGACEVLADGELLGLFGTGYTTDASVIEGFGESCTIRASDNVRRIDLVLAGPTFYLPAAWNEVEIIEGIGDEAFLTTGLDSPFLYAKQGAVVVSISAANFDPPVTLEMLGQLVTAALDRASMAAISSDPSESP